LRVYGLESKYEYIGTKKTLPVQWGVKRWHATMGWRELESLQACEPLDTTMDTRFVLHGPGSEAVDQVAVRHHVERIKIRTDSGLEEVF
jgi:hypothetical protein